MAQTPDSRAVLEGLRSSRKYGHICPDALARIAAWSVARSQSGEEALKRAKRKLHQVFGAFLAPELFARVGRLVDGLGPGASEEKLEWAARSMLSMHASTRERAAIYRPLHRDIFRITGQPRRVLDLACGLHPFGLPLMGLDASCEYTAVDLDGRLADLLGRFFAAAQVRGRAVCADILGEFPDVEADLVLLLKTAPGLERQEKGATARLLSRLRAPHAAVSFPVATLSGRGRGMHRQYSEFFQGLAAERGWPVTELGFAEELVFVVALGRSGDSRAR
jgi:16S rRNA (guanine(1405)-N(7))-methyltransferase